MALKLVDIEIIFQLIKLVPQPARILSFGHPDILATPDDLEKSLGIEVGINNDQVRKERIGRFSEDFIGSAYEVFYMLNAELTVLDQRNSPLGETFNLNFPIKSNYYDKYSIVIDPGTLEHIFNVGTGLENIVNALQVGGFVFHANPINMYNHGYWNFSPITYKEFYEDNGFEIVRLEGHRKKGTSFDIPVTARFRGIPENSIIVCVARKIEKVSFISWPIQGKYRDV